MTRVFFVFFLIAFLVSRAFAATAEDYYAAGVSFYSQKQYEKSIPCFKSALQSNPNHWQSYQGLGQAYHALGDPKKAIEMMEKSLGIHPDNTPLKRWVNQLRKKSSVKVTNPGEKITEINPILRNNRVFARVHSGYYTGFFEDLANSKSYYAGNESTSQTHDPGIALRTEIGYSLDRDNAIGLDCELVWGGRFQWVAAQHIQTITPQMFSISANYQDFWPDLDGRWHVKIGVGFYSTSVTYALEPAFGASFTPIVGTVGGATVGASCSAGREFILFGNVGLDLSTSFHYARFNQVTGSSQSGSGKMTLGIDDSNHVGPADVQDVEDNLIDYAALDFTGFDLGLAIEVDFQ